MDFIGEFLDALSECLRDLGELRVLFQQFQYLRGLFRGQFLPLDAGKRQRFPVLCVGVGVRLISIGLAGLGQQDQWRCMKAKGQVQENERVDIKFCETGRIERDPNGNHNVWETRKVGVPKNLAKPSALTPNQSFPNGDERCA